MRPFKLIPLMLTITMLVSCGKKQEETTVTINVDTAQEFQDPEDARNALIEAWKSNDADRIRTHAASDAVIVLNGIEVTAENIPGFYRGDSPLISFHLQPKSLKKGSTDYIAYDTGTFIYSYSIDTATYKGSYTFVWERGEDESEWKAKAINISDSPDNRK